jgi:hypothetical protein
MSWKSARCLLLAALIGPGVLLNDRVAAADNANEIGVVGAVAGTLPIATVETELNWPILVRRLAGQAGAVRIDSSLLTGPGGKLQPLRIQKAGAELAAPLMLDPGEQVELELAAKLPDHGEYIAELRLTTDVVSKSDPGKTEKKIDPLTVKITRGVREVTVVGATASGLSLTTPDPALEWLITVRRNDTGAGARLIRIEKPTLLGPAGRPQEVRLRKDGTDFDGNASLEPLSQIELHLAGRLPDVGDYEGEIALLVDGKRQSVPLKIKRELRESPVHIEEVSQVHATIANALPLRVRLQETEGKDFSVYRPEFVRLDQKDGTALVQAKYDSVKVYMDGKEAPQTISIRANQLLDLKIVINGLKDPGSYSGVVRLTSDTRKLVDKSFEIGLRRSVCFAAMVILLGVLVSAVLRGWLNAGRPVLVFRGSAAALRERLVAFQNSQGELTEDERAVLYLLLSGLDQITSPDASRPAAELEARLTRIRSKVDLLPGWINLRRNLAAVRPEKIGKDVRQTQKAVGAVLADPDATADQIKDAAAKLRAGPADLEKAIKDYWLKASEEFKAEIDALPAAEKAEMAPYSRRIDDAAADATQLASVLQEARKAYAELMIRTMREMLAKAQKPPGFDDAGWKKLVDDLSRQLAQAAMDTDEQRQIAMWTAARLQWLKAVSEGLTRRIKETLKNANNDAKPILGKAIEDLATVDKELQAGRLREAQAAYDSAVQSFQEARTRDTQLSATVTTSPAPAGVGTSIPDNVVESGWQNVVGIVLGGLRSSKDIAFWLLISDVALFIILGLVAVMVGLNLLYFDKPAWGSATDIAVALLWGFGLHAVAGNAFQGLQGIAKQIAGTAE